ncbi:hypothetical protein AVEN_144820-1, partial [Araneus ventricosus]
VGMNAHQEVCFIHRNRSLLLREDTIEKCIKLAVGRAQTVTQTIRAALDDDAYKRATKGPVGIVNMLQTGSMLHVINCPFLLPKPLSYLKAEIKSAALSIWQNNCDNGETGRSTYDIGPRVSNKSVGWNREEIRPYSPSMVKP